MKFFNKSNLGQEEMVGFAIILIIVAVILLVFISSSIKNTKNDELQNYEVSGFIQAFLQYTTDCQTPRETLTIQSLTFECEKGTVCMNEEKACDVLEETLKKIMEESWSVGEGEKYREKGYELVILADKEQLIEPITKGVFDSNENNYRGATQEFSKSGTRVKMEIFLNIYY